MSGPQRIVCLTEEPTEVLYALGEQHRIVGISGFTVRPAIARREKPKVSAFTSAKIGEILKLGPDFVVGFSDIQADIAAELIRRGVEVWISNHRSVEGILDYILRLGALVGAGARARAYADTLRSGLEAIERDAAALPRRPRVYFEEWDEPPITGIRWVAELVGHLVFADPANLEARALQADAFEQMGYQAESGPWRDFYLTGAQELRHPRPPSATPRQASAGQLRTMPTDNVLDSLSVRLNGEKVGATEIAFTAVFTDTGERFAVSVENAVLHHRSGEGGPQVELTRDLLVDLVHGAKTADEVVLEGPGAGALVSLLALLDRFDLWFEISAP